MTNGDNVVHADFRRHTQDFNADVYHKGEGEIYSFNFSSESIDTAMFFALHMGMRYPQPYCIQLFRGGRHERDENSTPLRVLEGDELITVLSRYPNYRDEDKNEDKNEDDN